ncbi:jmjC domain-containing protein 4 [Anoplophora glabripennis]|uniref:jmjC domain-containing protein 4 n=1 Tax=Anoplophora glabripennis TaxID=217634 RepID=UPI000873EDF8|nr:jmjC domain-containing protein 4 [Anoplophora glabripennis]
MEFDIENSNSNKSDCYPSVTEIPFINANELTYNKFFQNFMLKNVPCVIKNVTSQWQASQFWIRDDEPDVEYLLTKYGHNKVTIYNCNERYYNSQTTHESVFADYLKYWQDYNEDSALPLAYLKDWHLKLLNQNDEFYEVPEYFASDWLNEYYTACSSDDYRFIYMGVKNTWTPFHADVFTSYSWSANVCGRKKWLLFPPGEENLLRDDMGNLPYDVSNSKSSVKCFEIIQDSGEAIFVPSGWYHQVWNLKDTISVNHNWVNGCNIKKMCMSMMKELEAVRREIDDCRGMEGFEEHCQVMLNASFGMDYYKFYEFIKYIGLSRMEMLENRRSRILFHGYRIGQNHILFDLKAIQNVLEAFVNCDDINSLQYFKNLDVEPHVFLQQIVNIMENI